MSLLELLIDRRDDILNTFVREVRVERISPDGVSRPALIDHLPQFLEEIRHELSRAPGGPRRDEAVQVNEQAEHHGEQRWVLGYDLRDVISEYGVLMQAILEVARDAGTPLSLDEYASLSRYLNLGIAAAATEYVRSREEQQRVRRSDLEFLSEAGGLLSSSLDYKSTLGRLTRLIVPRLADFCVVQLDGASTQETPIAHIDPEKLASMREVLQSFSEAEVRDATDPPAGALRPAAVIAGLRELGAGSWLVAPLAIQGTSFGNIVIARTSSEPYEETERLLAEELANRAAGALDNARLYEISRAERARAEAATRTKDEFVAMVSHELRNPLNVIIGWLRLVRSGVLSDEKREHALEVIERNAHAQNQLVGDLLDISRVMSGKIRVDPAQVSLSNVVTLVLADARFALEAKRLQLHTSLPDEEAVMRGDGERLRQIVWNLLLNAIKFTPKGGQIWVLVERADSDLVLTVRDNGVGIPAEFLPHVFDNFRQWDSRTTRAHGGLGIGLSIVKHLVDLHGGSIAARSDGVGHGAEFIVRLPVSPLISATLGVAKIPAATPDTPSQTLARPAVLAGATVLVVDDDEDARELLRIVLESCDATVRTAASVRDALRVLETTRVDAVLSDIGMPGEDGYALIRTIRALPDSELANVPAIALTAFARSEDRDRARLEGFNAHMSKPVEPGQLLTALSDLLTNAPRSWG